MVSLSVLVCMCVGYVCESCKNSRTMVTYIDYLGFILYMFTNKPENFSGSDKWGQSSPWTSTYSTVPVAGWQHAEISYNCCRGHIWYSRCINHETCVLLSVPSCRWPWLISVVWQGALDRTVVRQTATVTATLLLMIEWSLLLHPLQKRLSTFQMGWTTPGHFTLPWAYMSQPPKPRIDRFSCFCCSHSCAQQTDRQTMLHVTSVAVGRIYAMHAMWPKIVNVVLTLTVFFGWIQQGCKCSMLLIPKVCNDPQMGADGNATIKLVRSYF